MGLKFILPHKVAVPASPEPDSTVENTRHSKWGLLSPINIPPVSLHEIAHRATRVKQRLSDSATDRDSIAEATVDQQKSRTWYDVRQPRITASQCKRCVMKSTTSPTKAIEEVLLYHANCQTRAMKEGIEWEPKIIEKFTNETGHQVKKTGFLISESHPFLGASPDGMTDKGNLVEIKKVTSREGENLQDTMCRLYIYKRNEDQLLINKTHKYFYQIQQQLFCGKLQYCHFVISNGDEMFHELVTFDATFWEVTLLKLEKFYFHNIFPELVYPRIKFGETRWNKMLEFPRSS